MEFKNLPTNIHSKISYFINIKLIVSKLWIFTNLNMVFPVVVLVFDLNESSEGVLHGHWLNILIKDSIWIDFGITSLWTSYTLSGIKIKIKGGRWRLRFLQCTFMQPYSSISQSKFIPLREAMDLRVFRLNSRTVPRMAMMVTNAIPISFAERFLRNLGKYLCFMLDFFFCLWLSSSVFLDTCCWNNYN
jgi:hypothetical protein